MTGNNDQAIDKKIWSDYNKTSLKILIFKSSGLFLFVCWNIVFNSFKTFRAYYMFHSFNFNGFIYHVIPFRPAQLSISWELEDYIEEYLAEHPHGIDPRIVELVKKQAKIERSYGSNKTRTIKMIQLLE